MKISNYHTIKDYITDLIDEGRYLLPENYDPARDAWFQGQEAEDREFQIKEEEKDASTNTQ